MLFALIFPLLCALSLAQNPPPRPEYRLKSQEDYVAGYHTGAGLSDAVLVGDISAASRGYLNGTRQQFDLGSGFPWGLVMTSQAPYSEWKNVQINAGSGSDGFWIDENDNLQWDNQQFNGWLVCDWSHGVPQLFWMSQPEITMPDSCYRTELAVEYI